MSKADLMLALNEALQRAGESIHTRFCQIKYSSSEAISALLTDKTNAGVLISRISNVLIRAAKTVNPAVVGVEILEHWQCLKVHRMSLERYLGERSMKLLKREVESSTGIQLKALPRWLINKSRLREQQEAEKRGSVIVITVKGKAETKKLCASGLRFGGVVRVVESCEDRPSKCFICAGPHKVEDHYCGIAGCNKGKGKICIHVIAEYANYRGAHAANSPRCGSRHKADLQIRQDKKVMGKKDKTQVEDESKAENMGTKQGPEPEKREESPLADTNMDLGDKDWTQYAKRESSGIYHDES